MSSLYHVLASKLIGSKLEEAIETIKAMNAEYRIASEDGINYMLTEDYRFDRINLDVEDGVIIRATVG